MDTNLMKKAEVVAQKLKSSGAQNPSRDPARIPVMLEAIREKWEKDPDLRLAQLIVNAISPSEPCTQVYYFEDDELMSRLKE